MTKKLIKPGTMVYPVPSVMVSCSDKNGNSNIITIAWTGTICSDPPMAYISIRPERFSYDMIKESGCFVINIPTEKLVKEMDYCGVASGRDIDKFHACGLTPSSSSIVSAPLIEECPVNIECKVKEILPLGSHSMFIAEVVAVNVNESLFSKEGKMHLNKAGLVSYCHGEYRALGASIGTFGYSVRKKPMKQGDEIKKVTKAKIAAEKAARVEERNKKMLEKKRGK